MKPNQLFAIPSMQSLSAKRSSSDNTVASLIAYQIPDERVKEFRSFFHRPRNQCKPFQEFCMMLGYYSDYVNRIFATLQYAVLNSKYLENEADPGAVLFKVFESYAAQDTAVVNVVKNGMSRLSAGRTFIIRDSHRFPKGKDFVFSGTPFADSPIFKVPMDSLGNMVAIPATDSPLSRKLADDPTLGDPLSGVYQTKIGKAAIETAAALQRLILNNDGIDTKTGAFTRLSGDFSVARNLIRDIHTFLPKSALAKAGVLLTLPEFPHFKPALEPIGKYIQATVIREPNMDALNFRAVHKDKPVEELGLEVNQALLAPSLNFTLTVSLPLDFAQFISQSDTPTLFALSTWAAMWSAAAFRPPAARTDKAAGNAQSPKRTPFYILSPSKLGEVVAVRKKLGLFSEKGRGNEDGICLNSTGTFSYIPKQDELGVENAKAYEKLMEESLELCYRAGIPTTTGVRSIARYISVTSPDEPLRLQELHKEIAKYAGTMLVTSWDHNTVLTTSRTEPERMVPQSILGATSPTALSFAHVMRKKPTEILHKILGSTTLGLPSGNKTLNSKSAKMVDNQAMAANTAMLNFSRLYSALAVLNKVPAAEALVAMVAKAFGIQQFTDNDNSVYELNRYNRDQTIYDHLNSGSKTLSPDLKVGDDLKAPEKAGTFVYRMLEGALLNADGNHRSTVATWAFQANVDVTESDHFFATGTSTVGEFSNLFNFFGGRVFHEAAKAFLAVPKKELLEATRVTEAHDGRPLSEDLTVHFASIMNEVIPFASIFGKYVAPDVRDKMYEEADRLSQQNTMPIASEEDIVMPGGRQSSGDKSGMMMFPHQGVASALAKNHPPVIVYDISAGGGKTTIGILDYGNCVHDKVVTRPGFIICPDGLVGNWVEDLHKHTEGRWNAIPINSDVYGLWGDERLTELILKAPINTVVVVGNSFLSKTGRAQLVIGNSIENTSNAVEFVKKFQPEWVFLDESHRARNERSNIHRMVKNIFTISSVKYVRIGTGTLIQNVMSDIVGQTALFNSQVFGTRDDFDDEFKEEIADVNGKTITDYRDNTPIESRKRLGEFVTVISAKRKEWAFMLPDPIESFLTVAFEDPELPNDEAGRAHRMFYDAVLKQTLEELKVNPTVKKLIKGNKEDDEEDDDSSDTDNDVETHKQDGIDVSDSSDDDSTKNDAFEAVLRPYLQRLERLLTDPFGDEELLPVAKEFFGDNVNQDNYVTSKVRKIIERLKMHFTQVEWRKGGTYSSLDMADYEGKTYVFRSHEYKGKSSDLSTTPPPLDNVNWKEQERGKVIIFCRFTRSVDAIFRALPKEYQAMATRFHGEVGSKWDNLDSFKKDPKVKILIANEMGISEGHNLQMATRFIRAESPWAPGELDQSMSRIFRPDVGGKYARQVIFLDWIVCDGTLEICKMGRLVSKMLKKTQFDELYNEKFYKDLNPLNLPIIKMSLDNIAELNSINALCHVAGVGSAGKPHEHSYIGQYMYLVQERASEFKEMRETKRAEMIPVKSVAMPEGSRIIDCTPWVANMYVPDRHDEGLVPLKTVLSEDEDPLTQATKADPRALVNQYVRTEFGIGIITGVHRGGSEAIGISSLNIKLLDSGNIENFRISSVYLIRNIDTKAMRKKNKGAVRITSQDVERTSGNAQRRAEREQRAEQRQRRMVENSRPIKPKVPAPVVKPKVKEQLPLELHAIVYNGFLALEAITDMPSKDLKPYGFKPFGDYAWLQVKNLKEYEAILDYLEAKFTLSPKTERMLETLFDSFQTGRGRKFAVELSPYSELPNFYRVSHTMTKVTNTRKPELKLYPVILDGSLLLVVDIATNPVIKKHVGKTIPGTTAKFDVADGLDVAFFRSKAEMNTTLRNLEAAGIAIENRAELKDEIKELDLKQVQGK